MLTKQTHILTSTHSANTYFTNTHCKYTHPYSANIHKLTFCKCILGKCKHTHIQQVHTQHIHSTKHTQSQNQRKLSYTQTLIQHADTSSSQNKTWARTYTYTNSRAVFLLKCQVYKDGDFHILVATASPESDTQQVLNKVC